MLSSQGQDSALLWGLATPQSPQAACQCSLEPAVEGRGEAADTAGPGLPRLLAPGTGVGASALSLVLVVRVAWSSGWASEGSQPGAPVGSLLSPGLEATPAKAC